MADETTESTISAAVPPKVNPLGSPIKPGASTVKLNPAIRKPMPTQTALKPGLKLPPKPGVPAAGGVGLKLPTQNAIRPGIKLPAKPVIRKPGATVAAKPLPKPIVGAPATAPVPAATSAAPAAVAATPVAPAAPASTPVTPIDAQGVGKLPTVEAKPIARDAVAPVVTENPNPMEALKSVTQKLKGITQTIPQQAILRKTGIIADATSEAQKEAAKHKTARISLSDAMGVAPVKENAPMKTIKIKRPVDIPKADSNSEESATKTEAPETVVESGDSATVTQRKTLKISRPGGVVRPAGKFGIKRTSQAATVVKTPDAATPEGDAPAMKPVADGAVADIPEIANIPDMPASVPTMASEGPAWLISMSAIVQIAACAVMGVLAWLLFQNTQISYF